MPSMLDGQRSPIGSLAKLGEGVRANSDAKTQAGLGRGAGQSKKLVNAAWTNTFPAQGATLDLDFANDRGYVRGVGQGRSMDAVTFTRASNGTFVKPDGTLSQHSNQGALGKNLLTFPQDLDNGAWNKSSTTVIANATTAPNGTSTADALTSSVSSNALHLTAQISLTLDIFNDYTWSCYFKKKDYRWGIINAFDTDTGDVYSFFDLENGVTGTVGFGCTATIDDVGDGWYRCIVTRATTSDTGGLKIEFSNADNVVSFAATIGFGIFAWGAQLELGTTATEYFPTNINTPRFDWASTASTGAGTIASPYVIPLIANSTSNGLLIEEARTNRILWCRDATQSNWTKTNVTVAKTQTGIDGVANSASSLTASSANGTCIQTITLTSGSRTGSVYLKRITGTGNVQITLDGTTYSTVDLSTSEWRRIVLSGTVTNPTVGIRIVTSGDAVAMDFAQIEDGGFATSPIMTTSATAGVIRAAEATNINLTNSISILDYQSGTCLVNFKPYVTPISGAENNIINVGGNNGYFNFSNSITSRFALRAAGDLNGSVTGHIFPLTDNIIAASWASTGIKRSSNSGVFDQRFVNFEPFPPQNFQRLAALNSTTKRVIYYPFQVSITELQTLTGGAT